MKIISIFWGLCSGAAYCHDGKILAAISEERFTREKNDSRFPEQSIKWIFDTFNLNNSDIDYVSTVSNDIGLDYILLSKHLWSIEDYLDENNNYWKPKLLENDYSKHHIFDVMKHKINKNQFPQDYWTDRIANKDIRSFNIDSIEIIAKYFNLSKDKVIQIDHHESHAQYSYFLSSFKNHEVLSFTMDGFGDGKNATISKFDKNGNYELLNKYDNCIVARVYRYMTLLLGMKPSEHEFKVMGLAPYGKEKYGQKALKVFQSALYVDGLDFKSELNPSDSYFWFKERLEGVRFDNLAWALQKWTEDIISTWVYNAIEHYKVDKIIFSGGVSMNVKAMGEVAKLTNVADMFVGGSAGDESHIISTAYCTLKQKSPNIDIQKLPNLYLGCEFNKKDEDEVIKHLDKSKYDIISEFTSKDIAIVLTDGKIIARCCDKMEFGQRSLGNRSILADPSDPLIKEKINSAVKNRDFWMPFAPIILDTHKVKYIVNPKQIESPYMTIAFDTTDLGYTSMIAASHPSDKTCRAQILQKEHNHEMYDILEEFEKLTGRGALINTSFNLHGFPIVNSPKDALHVFENSDIDVLILNNFLIKKN